MEYKELSCVSKLYRRLCKGKCKGKYKSKKPVRTVHHDLSF